MSIAMKELFDNVLSSEAFATFATTIIIAIFGYIGTLMKLAFNEFKAHKEAQIKELEAREGKEKVEQLTALADIVVKFVQQTYQELNGSEKLEVAIESLKDMVEKQFHVPEEQLERYIEAAYNSAIKGFNGDADKLSSEVAIDDKYKQLSLFEEEM